LCSPGNIKIKKWYSDSSADSPQRLSSGGRQTESRCGVITPSPYLSVFVFFIKLTRYLYTLHRFSSYFLLSSSSRFWQPVDDQQQPCAPGQPISASSSSGREKKQALWCQFQKENKPRNIFSTTRLSLCTDSNHTISRSHPT
jgi:hypothetical protein